MARDPREVVSDLAAQAHKLEPSDPPKLLTHPPGASAPLAPVRAGPELTEVHAQWARIHQDGGHGMADKLAPRLGAATRHAQDLDRVLIGSLIRASEALAVRCDQLADRLAAVEALVEEVVTVMSEDLTQIRAALNGRSTADRDGPHPGAGDG